MEIDEEPLESGKIEVDEESEKQNAPTDPPFDKKMKAFIHKEWK
jgi:hypothetical protein